MDAGREPRSDPLFRIWLWGPLRVEKRRGETYESVQTTDWGGSNYPRLLLKALLCCPGRRGRREALIDMLWPEMESEQATANLNTATTKLRSFLRPAKGQESLLITEDDSTIYQLPDQGVLWVDSDAVQYALEQAERLGRDEIEALPVLEEAIRFSNRGTFLEGEESRWAAEKRATRERERYRGRIWLTESYVHQGRAGQAETILTALLDDDPFDEDVLCRLLVLLQSQGLTHQALLLFRRMKTFFAQERMEMSETTLKLAAHMKQERFIPAEPVHRLEIRPTASHSDHFQGIMSSQPYGGEQSLKQSRRQVLSGMISSAYTMWILSPYLLLAPDKQESLFATLHGAQPLNNAVLDSLANITQNYWKLSANLSAPLLSSLQGHFQSILQLLSAPHSSRLRQVLFSLASEAAQLLGKTLCDLRDYPLALSYYTFALKAALEAKNDDLWATALGRIALLFLSTEQPQQALGCLKEVQNIPPSLKIRSWCSAIKAEAYAYLDENKLCLYALEKAKAVTTDLFLEPDPYATGFTVSRLASYESSCYLHLHQPEKALPILQQAITDVHPASLRSHSRLLVYEGTAYTFLGSAQQACLSLSQALDLTLQTQSLDVLHHIHLLSEKLALKGNTTMLNHLNVRFQEVYSTITHRGDLYE